MVENGRKDRTIGLFQPAKCPKIPEKSRQNSPKPRQNDGKTAAKHRRRASFKVSRGGIIGPARGGAVLYSYVGRGGGCRGRMAGGAAVWCWYGVRAGCCPLLYSYVGRGGVRSPTGAASSARCGAAAGRGLSSVQRRRAVHHRPGAACPGRSVQRGGVLPPSPI